MENEKMGKEKKKNYTQVKLKKKPNIKSHEKRGVERRERAVTE